ncbi:MAG TPA: hypothetical protein VNT51_08145, partial [Miltoncostaeaceae bacterium]|nr:hypothetical protein [Miltoncostaeaceae bacterium]
MMLAMAAAAAGAVVAARALGLGRGRQVAAGVVTGLVPLLLGNLVETRFDPVLAALLAWLVAAAAAGRWRGMWGLLAAAVLVKLVPLVLIPVLVIWQAHRTSGRAALRGALGSLAAVAAPLAAIALVAPRGLWDMVGYHLDRPPQIESLPASYLLVLHELAGTGVRVENSFGSQGLAGRGAAVVAVLTTTVVIAVVVAVAATLAAGLRRSRRGTEARLMAAALAATMAAVVAGGKVLSPQFMLWLVPLGLLVGGRYGVPALATTVAALVATQLWFPGRYWDLVALESAPIWMLAGRNALLIALVAMCWPRPVPAAPPPDAPVPGRDPAAASSERAVAARFLVD